MRPRGNLFGLTFLTAFAACAACDGHPTPPSGTGGNGGSASDDVPCSFGDEASKCGGEDDAACVPELGEPGKACDDDEDCDDGELCFLDNGSTAGVCRSIDGVCTAVPEVDEGLRFGESCDPTESQDPCAGACVPIGNADAGECEQTCRVGAESGCGEASLSGANVACAFFAYDLSDAGIEQGTGDLGICAHFCHCNADCPGAQLCLSAPTGDWAGICAGGIEPEDSVDSCATGEGGMGGAEP